MRENPPKQHREAFPSLEASEVTRRVRNRDWIDCWWHDENGELVAVGHFQTRPPAGTDGVEKPSRATKEIKKAERPGIFLNYRVLKRSHLVPGSRKIVLPIKWDTSNVGHRRAWFTCPSCHLQVSKLYCVAHNWKCGACSNLVYTSQRMPRRTRDLTRYEKLRALVGKGRPQGMHQRTYDRHLEALNELEKKLQATGRQTPNLSVAKALSCRWIKDDD